MKNYYLFLLYFFTYNTTLPTTVFIVIHGTWGAESSWYMPGGDFFDTLEMSVQQDDAVVVPFRWSGKAHPNERKKAAHQLAKLIQTYKDTNTSIVLVAHSHGGTVGILASHMITKKIDLFYALGTPVNTDHYPNMEIIDYFYNFFSLEDMVQTVGGMFEREYRYHERVANIRVFFDEVQPGHSELHHPYLAQWLSNIHSNLVTQLANSFSQPGLLYFTKTIPPHYKHDNNRQELIERDKRLSILMINSMRIGNDRAMR